MSEPQQPDGTLAESELVAGLLGAIERPALVCDADRSVRHWNDRLVDKLAIDGDALQGTPVERLVEFDGAVLDRTLRKGTDATCRGTLDSGDRTVPCRITCRPLSTESTVATGAVVSLDIAESAGKELDRRESAGKELDRRESGDRDAETGQELSVIVDNLPVVLIIVDGEGTIDRFDATGVAGIDATQSDLLGRTVEELSDEYAAVADACRRAAAGETVEGTIEVGDTILKGVFEPFDRSGGSQGAIGVGLDVTERVTNQRELAGTKRRLDLALENTDAGVFEWQFGCDEAYWGDSLLELLGYETGQNYRSKDAFHEIVHPDDLERHQREIWNSVDGDGEFDVTVRIDHPNKGLRWIRVEGEVEYDADGEPERIVGIDRDVTERTKRERELKRRQERLETIIESSPDPILLHDAEARYQLLNDAAVSFADISREEAIGRTPAEAFDTAAGVRITEAVERVLETGEPETIEETFDTVRGERAFQTTRAPVTGPDDEPQGVVSVSRDVTERKRQQAQLERLARVQRLIHQSVGALASATTEDEIKSTVCERLADSEFYELAWIGSRGTDNLTVEPEVWAGSHGGYLDDFAVRVDPGGDGDGPLGRAYRTGEVAVAQDIAGDSAFGSWREPALGEGFRSAIAVPLTHGSITRGVLAVYAPEPNVFTGRERAGFEALGEILAFALAAAQNRRLLESETVQHLEFVATAQSAFANTAEEDDCRFVFEGGVRTDTAVQCYLTVEGTDPDAVRDAITDADTVAGAVRLESDDGPHYEVTVVESIFETLSEAGARATRVVVEDDIVRIFAESPADGTVRDIHAVLESVYPDVELTTRRDGEPSESGRLPGHGELGARLTDRQREVLRAAYYSGYYEWPRDTDAENLADDLDVATPTLLQHLRRGHNRVMTAMFDR